MKKPNYEKRPFELAIPNLSGDGIAETVTIQVEMEWDDEVKEWLLAPGAHRFIEDTQARYMGLILPHQMKELRERLGYTQTQMGELFQVGEKSWTRWESGKHRPTRSIGLLIQALYEGEISAEYLVKKAGMPAWAKRARPLHEFAWQAVLARLERVETKRQSAPFSVSGPQRPRWMPEAAGSPCHPMHIMRMDSVFVAKTGKLPVAAASMNLTIEA
jgi:DNA-binding XRE family transcriptional regulator